MEQFDIIFCRNVMMYLIPDAVRAVVARLTRALAPAGFLFLSHAETLRVFRGISICDTPTIRSIIRSAKEWKRSLNRPAPALPNRCSQ